LNGLYTHTGGRLRNYLADVPVADHAGSLGLAVVVEVEFNALENFQNCAPAEWSAVAGNSVPYPFVIVPPYFSS